ncbi:MAG: LamG domain-containing protein, partial [Candidatus Poribacteria bacterium]|nr:LamG domain-containing protein [Candidatus Poribacteria bacterium]
ALEFGGEGSDVFVTVESTAKLNVDEMTFMAWVNAEHWNGTRQIVGKSVHGGCGGRVQYGLFSEGGTFKLRFETEAGRNDISTGLPDTEKFIHIAFTNDTKKGKIYIDGKEEAEGDVPGKLGANDDPWRIGQDCDRLNYVFAGIIDEVRLWNRALSEDEINTFMEQGVDALAVEAAGKLSTTWSRLKAGR